MISTKIWDILLSSCAFFERVTMIKIENLTITTRQPILKNFSFNFESGNIYQIMAENGAGKSTFLRALTQLTSYKGKIVYENKPYEQNKCIILTSHYANEIEKLHNVTKLKLENLTMQEVN